MTELNPTGTNLIYSTYLGGSGFDVGGGIAVDTFGNAYVMGLTGSSRFPTTAGAFQTAFGGNYDAFVAKFSASQIALTASQHRVGETVVVRLVWTGAKSDQVAIYRDEVPIKKKSNTGRYRDGVTVPGVYTYAVCEAGTMECSNEVRVKGP